MKTYSIFLLFLSLLVFSCTDTVTNVGQGIQPNSDQISIGCDTFHLNTADVFIDKIYSRPDSFLLGSFYDTKFGTTQADILAQVNCPEGFRFPSGFVGDSAKVQLYYYTCSGDTLSPLDINIYEMTGPKTLSYSTLYPSNINPSEYCNTKLKLAERIISAKQNSSVSKVINFNLSSSFVQRFSDDSKFTNTTTFLNFFKGMYITTNFGSATLLNVGVINLKYFYHYTYKTKNISGGDSIATVNDYILFPANQEVRQVNRILHLDRMAVVHHDDSLNYIAAPANIQTQVSIPLKKIQTHINNGIAGKTLAINSASIKVEVTETTQDTTKNLHQVVKYMLLIKESAIDRFFDNNELPSDTCAVLAQYSNTQIGSSGVYEQYYNFVISKLIANELAIAKQKNIVLDDKNPLNLRLIPVSVATSTNSSGTTSISTVKQQYLMNAVTIRSGKNPYSPMRLNLVYSGF